MSDLDFFKINSSQINIYKTTLIEIKILTVLRFEGYTPFS